MTDTGPPPRLAYWHLWTDAQGVSRQERREISDFVLQRIGPADPQWNAPQPRGETTVVFNVLPVGWVGEWHENPAPQWIVPLSGRWWVEAMDGTRAEMGPGELSFGADQHCTPDGHGRFGHRSGTIGAQPAVLMSVRLNDHSA